MFELGILLVFMLGLEILVGKIFIKVRKVDWLRVFILVMNIDVLVSLGLILVGGVFKK